MLFRSILVCDARFGSTARRGFGEAETIDNNLRNFRGQYSDATLNELESQNDGQVEGILGKVKQLKDVCMLGAPMLKGDTNNLLLDDDCNWRRDPRIFSTSRKDERFI